jgi:hypothetical protein
VAYLTYFFRRLLRDLKLANDVSKWRVQCVRHVKCLQLVATLRAIIMNMVSGAANLKNSGIKRASI